MVSVARRGAGTTELLGDEELPPSPVEDPAPSSPAPVWAVLGLGAAMAMGLVLRFWTRSQLWLDEALTVDIAKLPVAQIPEALRHDGAPPLYYVVLHGWMRVFGSGDVAVRTLSGLFAVAAVPAIWLAARRVGGKRAAWACAVLLVGNPFAIRYSTEARMYSLVVLEATLGTIAVLRAFEKPTRARLAVVALSATVLLYTHYWSIYLLAATFGCLAWMAWRDRSRARKDAAWRILLALICGAIGFLPWAPSFLYQSSHTGTPWSERPGIADMLNTVREFAGGGSAGELFLTVCLFLLFALGLFGKALHDGRVELDLRTRPRSRELSLIAAVTAGIAILVGSATGAAFAARYTSVLFPLFLVVVALGVETIANKKAAAIVLAVVVGMGLQIGFHHAGQNRTQATNVARAIRTLAKPGDLVVMCPDQLGPSVHRAMGDAAFKQVTIPTFASPELVDWVDYQAVWDGADARIGDLAASLSDLAGGHDIWMAWAPNYRLVGAVCSHLMDALDVQRPGSTLVLKNRPNRFFESVSLTRFPTTG